MAAGKEAAGPGWRVRRLEGRADMERAAALVAADLRPADVRELWAAGGHAPAEAVRASLAAVSYTHLDVYKRQFSSYGQSLP